MSLARGELAGRKQKAERHCSWSVPQPEHSYDLHGRSGRSVRLSEARGEHERERGLRGSARARHPAIREGDRLPALQAAPSEDRMNQGENSAPDRDGLRALTVYIPPAVSHPSEARPAL